MNAALVMELCVADGVRNFSTVSLKFAPRTAGEGPICMPPFAAARRRRKMEQAGTDHQGEGDTAHHGENAMPTISSFGPGSGPLRRQHTHPEGTHTKTYLRANNP